MCLLVLAWEAHPRYRLIVAANRDEYHDRPAAPLAPWSAPEGLLAGRDLRAGGTWLGLDRRRRFGVITNFRELTPSPPGAPSRGQLIPRYLQGEAGAGAYLGAAEAGAAGYGGFNLLLADERALWYGSNRSQPFARELPAGIYGLSNERLDTPWPKLRRVRRAFESWLGQDPLSFEPLFAALGDREPAAAQELPPPGGLEPQWERALSAPFVVHPRYGTRCSTVLALEHEGALRVMERRFGARGEPQGESDYRVPPGQWV